MKEKFLFHLTASGLYTSLALSSLCLSTYVLILNSKPNWIYFSFIFFSTYFYYNFHKISWYQHPRIHDHSNIKYRWPAKYPGLVLMSLLLSFIGCMALSSICINSFLKLVLVFIALFIALFYNQKLFGVRLRSLKGFKPFTIAIVTIITTVIIPIADELSFKNFNLLGPVLYIAAQFFFVSALCVLADLRDINEDWEDKIKTFPVVTGIEITIKLVFVLLMLTISLQVILFQIGYISFKRFELLLIISLFTILLASQLKYQRSYFYFILLVDGLILCQSIGILWLQ